MIHKSILVCLLFLLSLQVHSQGQVLFEASVNAQQVLEGTYIEYKIELENANGTNLKIPKFEGFTIVSGPMQSSGDRMVNGRIVSRKKGYSYTLLPAKVGNLTIPPATVQVNGKTLKTKSINIKVVAAGKKGDKPLAFIKMSLSDSTAVVGQQLLLTYTLYYAIELDIRRQEIKSEDQFTAFEAERVQNYRRPALSREIIDGKEYYYRIAATTTLIPKDIGDIVINGVMFNLRIPSNDGSYGRFQSTRLLVADSEDLKLNVRELPLVKPPDNSGAIGAYNITSTVNKLNITEDDAINLTLKITGTGISKDVIAPEYESTDKLDIYDPSLISENTYIREGQLYHETTYEYLIVPKSTGRTTFTPTFTFYDTDSLAYRTITANPHNINVRKSDDASKVDDSEAIQQQSDELVPIYTKIQLKKKSKSFYKSTAYWICLGVLALAFIAMGIFKWILIQKDKEDPELKKARQAQKVALDKLQLAKTYLDKNEIKPFYKEISNAMLGYVCDKLKMDTADITKTNVAAKLQEISVSQQDTDRFIKLLNNSEMALYAGSQDAASMQQSYNDAKTLISDIEAQMLIEN